MAQRFDARELTVNGDSLPVVDRAGEFTSVWGPTASVSANGMLAYSRPVNRAAQLHWYTRGGNKLSSIAGSRNYNQLIISPDGRRVAVELADSNSVKCEATQQLDWRDWIALFLRDDVRERAFRRDRSARQAR